MLGNDNQVVGEDCSLGWVVGGGCSLGWVVGGGYADSLGCIPDDLSRVVFGLGGAPLALPQCSNDEGVVSSATIQQLCTRGVTYLVNGKR